MLSIGARQVNASSGRIYTPAHAPSVRAQPSPSKMVVRMFQAAQALEIFVDVDNADPSTRVIISNIIGKQIKMERVELGAGENTFRIEVGDLVQGTYIVQIVGNNFTSQARKFVKANP